MNSWLRQIALMAKVRTGFGAQLIVWFLIAGVSLAAALAFFSIAAFVSLASRYGGAAAGVILGGGFLLIAMIAAVAGLIARRRNIERARLELAARRSASWLDPKLMAIGIEVGRALGWRRIVTLAAVGLFAAGLGREWFGQGEGKSGDDGPPAD